MFNKYILKMFYLLKPLIPRGIQLYLRRIRCAKIISRGFFSWPIDPDAANIPVNWKGWPNDKHFALVLTHDVEKSLGVTRVQKLLELEKNLGFRSCFNFVADDYTVPDSLLQTLTSADFEIGIHGLHHNGFMYATRKTFNLHARGINKRVKVWDTQGFRSPSMQRNLEWIHALDIKYDSSTFDTDPFEPQPEGIKSIYPFWIPHRDGTTGYLELPYTLPQDFTLFIILKHDSIGIWKKKLDWLAQKGGMALINTHPDYMSWSTGNLGKEEYPVNYYVEFLEYVKSQYADKYWNPLPKELTAFYKSTYSRQINKSNITLNRLNVCMSTYSFYEEDSRVIRYAESLVSDGCDVDVFCLKNGNIPDYEMLNGVNVYRIQKRISNEKHKWSYFYRILKFLLKSTLLIAYKHFKKNYSLVHVHNIPDIQVFSALLPKLTGSKVILDIHDIVPELFCSKFDKPFHSLYLRFLRFLERMSCSFSDHIIVSNDIWGERIADRSAGRDKCTVLINYPDLTIFKKPSIEATRIDSRNYIIYPGSLNWHQGLDVAIKAFSEIRDIVSETDFYIYGSGPSLNHLKQLSKDLGITDRVLFHETIPLHEIAAIMANAKCGVVPKIPDNFGNEAFSTKILEFMALGVPVIISETDIDRHYFTDSQVLFFKPGDQRNLADKLLQLLTDESLRQKLIHNSLEFVEENNWSKKKNIYFSIVNSLTKDKVHNNIYS